MVFGNAGAVGIDVGSDVDADVDKGEGAGCNCVNAIPVPYLSLFRSKLPFTSAFPFLFPFTATFPQFSFPFAFERYSSISPAVIPFSRSSDLSRVFSLATFLAAVCTSIVACTPCCSNFCTRRSSSCWYSLRRARDRR